MATKSYFTLFLGHPVQVLPLRCFTRKKEEVFLDNLYIRQSWKYGKGHTCIDESLPLFIRGCFQL